MWGGGVWVCRQRDHLLPDVKQEKGRVLSEVF